MRRILVWTLSVAVLVAAASHSRPLAAQPKIPKVLFCAGYGTHDHLFSRVFVDSMARRGWHHGKNVQVVIPPNDQCVQALQADVDVVVAGDAKVGELQAKKPGVAIVTVVGHAEVAKHSSTPGRPIGHVTGLFNEDPIQLQSKRMALLKEAAGAKRIVFLSARAPGPEVKAGFRPGEEMDPLIQEAARKLGVGLGRGVITTFADFEPTFKAIAAQPGTALVFGTGMYWYQVEAGGVGVQQFIERHRIPVMATNPDFPLAWKMLIGYGISFIDMQRRCAYFVDRILRGDKPTQLPFELVPLKLGINLDSAKELGITLPPSILLQADYVAPRDPPIDWYKPPPPGR